MYSKDGINYYIVDGHVHFWNAAADNRNRHGAGFIECFYGYHSSLSPEEWLWSKDRFDRYSEDGMIHDLFEVGYADKAIFQPTYLKDFFPGGFNTIEQNAEIAARHPGRFIVNGAFDPRDGEDGLRQLEEDHRRHGIKGVKLYTAEWKGSSRGWKLSDAWALRYLEKCQELGITNIHVHKGPTIWPLDRDAFDVKDIDVAATEFPDLTFVVEHCGLPRLEDFCWIATQEPNVYAGLAVAIPFIHSRPRYFAQIIGELLFWLDENRVTFASDYAIWQPKWLVEKFVDFQIPEDMQSEYGQLTTDVKRKILGLNLARLYDLKVPDEAQITESLTGSGTVANPEAAVGQ